MHLFMRLTSSWITNEDIEKWRKTMTWWKVAGADVILCVFMCVCVCL